MSYPGQPPMGMPGMPPMPYMVGAPPPIIGGVMPMAHVSIINMRMYFDQFFSSVFMRSCIFNVKQIACFFYSNFFDRSNLKKKPVEFIRVPGFFVKLLHKNWIAVSFIDQIFLQYSKGGFPLLALNKIIEIIELDDIKKLFYSDPVKSLKNYNTFTINLL